MNKMFNYSLYAEKVFIEAKIEHLLLKAEKYVGRIIEAKEVSGGNVHYVYKVDGSDNSIFIKIRGNHFARIPSIETKAEFIQYERRALELFNREIPSIFPTVLEFDEEACALFLTNVFYDNCSFEEKLNSMQATVDDMQLLGDTVGVIHVATAHLTEGIREDQDADFRNKTLQYWLEASGHPRLLETSCWYRASARNLIVGDLSPKNMSVCNGKIGICDLENAHQGAHIFDIACIMAHILLHYIKYIEKAEMCLKVFQAAYANRLAATAFDEPLLLYMIIGILMYRLVNPVIPYKLTLPQEGRETYYNLCKQALELPHLTLNNLLDVISSI